MQMTEDAPGAPPAAPGQPALPATPRRMLAPDLPSRVLSDASSQGSGSLESASPAEAVALPLRGHPSCAPAHTDAQAPSALPADLLANGQVRCAPAVSSCAFD